MPYSSSMQETEFRHWTYVLNIFHISCFQGLARNLEQPEVKDWLTTTKDQLMGDKGGKEKEEESKKINAILVRQAQILISFWLYNICLIFVLYMNVCKYCYISLRNPLNFISYCISSSVPR